MYRFIDDVIARSGLIVRHNMSVNEDYIEARIREIKDAVEMLRGFTVKSFKELTIHERLSMRYLVIQLVESASSICMHILLRSFNERADSFPECFMRLGIKGVIPTELASKLPSAARLRNLLMHRYWTIIDEEVYKSVEGGLKDLEAFAVHIRSFLEKYKT